MKRLLAVILATVALSTAGSLAVAHTVYPEGTVNIRNGPGITFPIIGQLRDGEGAAVMGQEGQWLKIRTGAAVQGYVADWVVRKGPDQTPPDAVEPDRNGLVKQAGAAASASMHSGRDKRYARIASVTAGEMLSFLASAEGWVQVRNRQGQQGWINGNYVYFWDRNLPFRQQAAYGMIPGDWRMRFLPVRAVVAGGEGLRLRSGAAPDTPVVRHLGAGDEMKLLAVPGGEFVKVQLPDGEVGWVSRNWLRPVPGLPGESVRLSVPAAGVIRLEVTGLSAAAGAQVQAAALVVPLPHNPERRAALPVGQHGVEEIVFDADGLTLRMDRSFTHRVTEQSAAKTVVEIRPLLVGVEVLADQDRSVYRFHNTGVIAPHAGRDGDRVKLQLPGALLGPGFNAPAGVTVTAAESKVQAEVTSTAPYAVRTGAGFVDLILYRPGLQGKVIVIDPGHGGAESGAVGPTGLREKDANLAIARRLHRLLGQAGVRVVMTRSGDSRCADSGDLARIPKEEQLRYELHCRAQVSNAAGADAFVSLHGNGHPNRNERGTETYWTSENVNAEQSRQLAGLVQQELLGALGLKDRGVKHDMFYVIKFAEAPAVLAEIAFVNHPAEEALLKDGAAQQRSAEAVYRALSRYFR